MVPIQYVHLGDEPADRKTALLARFYEQIYRDAFPKADQAEGPEIWLPCMSDELPPGQPRIWIVLAAEQSDCPLGGVIFEQYRASGCWLISYIAVAPNARRRGVAAGLISEVVRTIQLLQPEDWTLFAEAENPRCVSEPVDRARAEERLGILQKLGMRYLGIRYVQPPLGPDKRALDDLLLLCYAPHDAGYRVPAHRVQAFLVEFFTALDQASSPYLAQISSELTKQNSLETLSLDCFVAQSGRE